MIQIMTTLPDVQVEPHPHSIGGHQNLAGVRWIIELRIQEQRIIELRIQEQIKVPTYIQYVLQPKRRASVIWKTKFFKVKIFCGQSYELFICLDWPDPDRHALDADPYPDPAR
jgi:hypothetical protein